MSQCLVLIECIYFDQCVPSGNWSTKPPMLYLLKHNWIHCMSLMRKKHGIELPFKYFYTVLQTLTLEINDFVETKNRNPKVNSHLQSGWMITQKCHCQHPSATKKYIMLKQIELSSLEYRYSWDLFLHFPSQYVTV